MKLDMTKADPLADKRQEYLEHGIVMVGPFWGPFSLAYVKYKSLKDRGNWTLNGTKVVPGIHYRVGLSGVRVLEVVIGSTIHQILCSKWCKKP